MADTFDPSKVYWVNTLRGVEALAERIRDENEIVFDLETTGLDEWATATTGDNGGVPARIVMAQYTFENEDTALVPLFHPESPLSGHWKHAALMLANAMADSGAGLIGHNIKFDCRWFYACTGVDLAGQIAWDTRISSHLLDETRSTRLKDRAPETFGIDAWDDFDLNYPGAALDVPLIDLGMYGARDTYWTKKLADLHRRQMNLIDPEEPMGPDEIEDARLGQLAVWCVMPMVAALTRMEQRGFAIDTEWVQAEISALEQEAAEAFDWLVGLYRAEHDPECAEECVSGCRARILSESPSFAPTAHWFKAWTAEAVDAGDLQIAALTPSGVPQWTKGVLARQARKGSKVAETLLTYRSATKRLEFLRAWLTYVTQAGTIHTTYNAGVVSTGRLSSSGPNMQQITKSLRPAFVPRPGYYIADLDYSQVELRVAAVVSRCEPMIEAFRRGDDLHRLLASEIVGKNVEDVTPDERSMAKPANFGLLYGMGALGFREYAEDVYGVVFTEEEAVEIHEAFFSLWVGMKEWHSRMVTLAHRDGQVVSPIGRVRRLPAVWDGNDRMVAAAERQAINAPVQGFASDLLQMAAASIEGVLPGTEPVPDVRLVGTVHDSLVVEVPAHDWKRATARCLHRMQGIPDLLRKSMHVDFDVPLLAEASVGTRWGLSDVGVIS